MLFKKEFTRLPLVNAYFNIKKSRNHHSNLIFVRTTEEFKQNLASRFSSERWIQAIDFSKLVIVGGCVLNALCRSPFSDTKEQDINLVYYADNIFDFHQTVEAIVDILKKMNPQNPMNEIKLDKIPGTPCYHVFLSCNVQLTFSMAVVGSSKYPLSHILHNFDLDICQVAFTGKFPYRLIAF